MKGIAYCGAHRTGKTTLAEAHARAVGARFIRTSVSAVARDLGIDLNKLLPWDIRMSLQWSLLADFKTKFTKAVNDEVPWITDRSPLDLVMYVMGDVHQTYEYNPEELQNYFGACYECTNEFFRDLIRVPPGIPVVQPDDPTSKGSLNGAYIQKLDMLMRALLYSESFPRHHLGVHQIPWSMLDLDQRVAHAIQLTTPYGKKSNA